MVRLAEKADLQQVNEIMNEINNIHVQARPDFFKENLGDAMMEYLDNLLAKENMDLFVYEKENTVYGFASVTYQ